MKSYRMCVEATPELDRSGSIQIGFFSVTRRSDNEFSKQISEINVKLKNFCLGKGFIYIDNDNINESCLNNSKFTLTRKVLICFQEIF